MFLYDLKWKQFKLKKFKIEYNIFFFRYNTTDKQTMTKLPFPYDLSIITKSINDGLDIDGIDEELKVNLLHNASLNGKIECVKLLIEAGAKLNVKCELLGFTPLHYSCFYDHFEITNLLLEAGSDRNITCQMNGYTPFHYAFGIYGQK